MNVHCRYNRVETLKQEVHIGPPVINNLLYWWYHLIIPINIPINMTTAQVKYLPQKKLINLSAQTYSFWQKNSNTPLCFMQSFQSKQNSFLGH